MENELSREIFPFSHRTSCVHVGGRERVCLFFPQASCTAHVFRRRFLIFLGACAHGTIVEYILQLFQILQIANHRTAVVLLSTHLLCDWSRCSFFNIFPSSQKKGCHMGLTSEQEVITSLCKIFHYK